MGREVVEPKEMNQMIYEVKECTEEASENKKHSDYEDDSSIASSGATSFKTTKSRVTQGTAPRFRSAQRAEKRKEYYQKLEEKHQALEAERKEAELRHKEEQEAAIKELRKNLKFKANPVPNFYYEGHPPKPALKKVKKINGEM